MVGPGRRLLELLKTPEGCRSELERCISDFVAEKATGNQEDRPPLQFCAVVEQGPFSSGYGVLRTSSDICTVGHQEEWELGEVTEPQGHQGENEAEESSIQIQFLFS